MKQMRVGPLRLIASRGSLLALALLWDQAQFGNRRRRPLESAEEPRACRSRRVLLAQASLQPACALFPSAPTKGLLALPLWGDERRVRLGKKYLLPNPLFADLVGEG